MSMLDAMGPISDQMATHILLMNVLAPLLAWVVSAKVGGAEPLSRGLQPAMLAQLIVLWSWHALPSLPAVTQSHLLHLLMQASLFLCALWFWLAVLAIKDDGRWRTILALLVTSKLFCLLGVLLVFAPRVLYPDLVLPHAPAAMPPSGDLLADQQLAGLLMLVACPATYVLAGIIIAARWFVDLEADRHLTPSPLPHAVQEAGHAG